MPINIKGKVYITVAERVKEFRTLYPAYSMIDEIISYDKDSILIKTTIYDENQRPIATGFAREEKTDSKINETSYVENCETSSWGRALANLGIGIDSEIASANEVFNAIAQQERKENPNKTLQDIFTDKVVITQETNKNAPQGEKTSEKAKSKFQELTALCETLGISKDDAITKCKALFNTPMVNSLDEDQFKTLKLQLETSKKYGAKQDEPESYQNIDFSKVNNEYPF